MREQAVTGRGVGLALGVVAFSGLALTLGLAFGGGAQAPLLVDPGTIVRYGLPAAILMVRISSSLTVGALLLAAFALPSTHPAFERAMLVSAWAAGTWTASSLAASALTFTSVYLEPLAWDDRFGALLASYYSGTEFGRAWLWSTVLAGVTTVAAVGARSYPAVFFTGVVAVAAIWPLSELGHAAGAASHAQAVSSSFVHNVFVGFWVGGLLTLALVYRLMRANAETLVSVLKRFSTVALVSVVVVSVSGMTNALIRVGNLESLLGTPYGQLVVAKAVLVCLLIALGAAGRGPAFGAGQKGTQESRKLRGRERGVVLGNQPQGWAG